MHGHNGAKIHSNRYLLARSCLSCTGSQRVSQHSDQLKSVKDHFNVMIANQRALMKAPQYRSGSTEKCGEVTRDIEEIIEGLDEHSLLLSTSLS